MYRVMDKFNRKKCFQRRKIRTDMISSPQGDLKHTGHVGLDGAYFGDISFLGGKYPHLPRQVVTPYKPQEDATDNNSSQQHSQDGTLRDSNRDSVRDSRNLQQNKHGNVEKLKFTFLHYFCVNIS